MATETQFNMVGGQNRYGRFVDFIGLSSATSKNEVATGVTENSGTADTLAAAEDGQFELTTGTSSGNRSMVIFDRNYVPAHGGPVVMEAGVTLHTALTTRSVFVGWTDLTTINIPASISSGTTIVQQATADCVGFIFDSRATSTTNWYIVGIKNSVVQGPTLVSSFGAPVADTFQSLRVEINPSGEAFFFINGVQVGVPALAGTVSRTTGMANAVTTTAKLTPVVSVATRTTAAASVYVDFLYAQKGRFV